MTEAKSNDSTDGDFELSESDEPETCFSESVDENWTELEIAEEIERSKHLLGKVSVGAGNRAATKRQCVSDSSIWEKVGARQQAHGSSTRPIGEVSSKTTNGRSSHNGARTPSRGSKRRSCNSSGCMPSSTETLSGRNSVNQSTLPADGFTAQTPAHDIASVVHGQELLSKLGDVTNMLQTVVKRLDKQEMRLDKQEMMLQSVEQLLKSSPQSSSSSDSSHTKQRTVPVIVKVC